jgi:predicted nucleotidyltransferase component of viral defense system
VFNAGYEAAVRLLLRCLPEIDRHPCFALEGGTAINMFVRDLARASVDIDLTYLPLKTREEALQEIQATLLLMAKDIERHISGVRVRAGRSEPYVVKLFITADDATVKIEPSLIVRGALHAPQRKDLCPAAQQHFQVFVNAQILSPADLYGGKLCAALDRQHPRDLFDVKLLLDDTGITPGIRRAFVVYLAGHERPMHELLAPKLQDIRRLFADQFEGMTKSKVMLDDLLEVQRNLAKMLVGSLDSAEKQFLVSVKMGEPEWGLLGIKNLDRLPAIQWKLINIGKMSPVKQKTALSKLMAVFEKR